MILHLVPTRGYFSRDTQKVFQMHFRPILQKFSRTALKNYFCETTASAYRMMVLNTVLGILYGAGVIDAAC